MNPLRLSTDGASSAPSGFSYFHNGKESGITAYQINETAKIYFRIPRSSGATSLAVDMYSEACNIIASYECQWIELSEGFDVYSLPLPIKKLGVGLYFFRPRIKAFSEELYGHRSIDVLYFDKNSDLHGLFQLTVSDFKHNAPEKMYGGIIYHIFVDRFMRGGRVSIPDCAKIVDGEWKSIPEYPEYPGAHLQNNTFYGGTLYGIIDKLDYIASLGVTSIYLSPIFESVSNHKYDTADYMQVDPMFGGDEALSRLISECNARGIVLILDGVFNHTGDNSVYFNRYGKYPQLGAYQSKSSPYYGWYDFKQHPDKYTCWWDIKILPRINPDILECGEYFVGDNGVISKYSKMGIYGFRLDVADELSDNFIRKIKERLSCGKESVLYGEVWEDASNKIAYDTRKKYYLGEELDGVMNYPLRTGIIDFLLGHGTEKLRYALCEVMNNSPERIRHAQMNLLGTHDTERILTIFGGESSADKSNSYLSCAKMTEQERKKGALRLCMAYTILATLPGIPAIFYGDEAGLEGYHDPFNRMPYPWGREDQTLISHYKKIGNIRINNRVYVKGDFKLYSLTPELLVFSRIDRGNEYMTVVNNSEYPITLAFSDISTDLSNKKKAKTHTVDSLSARIFKIRTSTKTDIV